MRKVQLPPIDKSSPHYRDGYARGLRQEHLTNASLHEQDQNRISELATRLGYRGHPDRAKWIRGYCDAFYGEV